MKNELDGLLLINKPAGVTSFDIVSKVRKTLKIKSVGHTGTLDPLATGLMIMLIGQATKLSDFFLKGNKGYRVSILLGTETDSWDRTGKVVKKIDSSHITPEQIDGKIKEMQGHLVLPIPSYSAKKVDGVKLVDRVRKGELVPEIEKDMFFYNLNVIDISPPKIELSFYCSKGSFVRSWVQVLGKKLGVGATVSELCRIYSEPFHLKDASTLLDLENGIPEKSWVPLVEILSDWPSMVVSQEDEFQVRNGTLPVILKSKMHTLAAQSQNLPGIRLLTGNNKLLSLIDRTPDDFKIRRVFSQA